MTSTAIQSKSCWAWDKEGKVPLWDLTAPIKVVSKHRLHKNTRTYKILKNWIRTKYPPFWFTRRNRYRPFLLSHFSRVRLCTTPKMTAHQAPPSLGFSRQEHWSGLPFPSPMHARVFSSTTIRKHQFFGAQSSLRFNSHILIWLLEKPSLRLHGPLSWWYSMNLNLKHPLS